MLPPAPLFFSFFFRIKKSHYICRVKSRSDGYEHFHYTTDGLSDGRRFAKRRLSVLFLPPPSHILINNTVYLPSRPLTGRYPLADQTVRRRSTRPVTPCKLSPATVGRPFAVCKSSPAAVGTTFAVCKRSDVAVRTHVSTLPHGCRRTHVETRCIASLQSGGTTHAHAAQPKTDTFLKQNKYGTNE
jgi:hypothetical protein